jgi:DNA polymerase elongation subunit (family B)
MSDFYTSFHIHKAKLLLRGVRNGKRYRERVAIKPYLFATSRNPMAEYKTIYGEPVDRIDFDNVWEARKYVKEHDNVANFKFYGLEHYEYVAINDMYPGQIDYDPSKIVIGQLDIECKSDDGFPEPTLANQEVTAISLVVGEWAHVFGHHPNQTFTPKDDKTIYYDCPDEKTLLRKFLTVWDKIAVDVVTGWNIEQFDIPYLVNRIKRLFGADPHGDAILMMLSPFGMIEEREVTVMHGQRTYIAYDLVGITTLDYQDLYKKFAPKKLETYKLDYVCYVELKERKLSYKDYDGLTGLYNNNYQLFIEYNIRDSRLVQKLEEKLGFLQQVFAFAYDAKVTYLDTFKTVRPWDVIIHNYLLDQKTVVHHQKKASKSEKFEGAYVKEPKPGRYKWVLSFDLTSLYPMLIQMYNIGPETFVAQVQGILLDRLLDKDHDTSPLLAENVCMTANGVLFTKERQGFLAALMERIFNDRAKYKKAMLDAKKKFEETKDPKWVPEIAKNNNFQGAKKIQMNSMYGALGNQYCRWYDLRFAEAITLSGKLSIRWIEKRLNAWLNELAGTTGVDYVIASDTDSLYLSFDGYVKKTGLTDTTEIVDHLSAFAKDTVTPFINQTFDELATYMNAFKNTMDMKRETIAKSGFWTAKKRYALDAYDVEGVRFKEPEIKVTGLESVRTTTPEFCRKKINEAYALMLRGEQDDFWKFNESVREEFCKLPFEDVAFPKGVNGLTKYGKVEHIGGEARLGWGARTPIHVRGSLLYNRLLQQKKLDKMYPPIRDSDKIRYSYMKMPNPLNEDVLSCPDILPRQFGLEKYIDYEKQFTKSYYDPIESVATIIGWTMEKRASLAAFYEDD